VPGNNLFKRPSILVFVFLFFWGGSLPAASDTGRQIEAPVRQSITTLKQTQQQEEQWRQEKEKRVARFEQLQQRQVEMQNRVAHLRQQLEAARTRMAAKEQQLTDIEQIAGQIDPFLEELVTALKARIVDDPPFLNAERRQRVDRLEGLMADPDVAVSEKYRKMMEALQVEAEYGFTIETYQETITLEGQTLLADIFRLGRQGGFYNPAAGAWQPLAAAHKQALHTAIDIAAKRRPVELLSLPLGRLVVR
jgi:chromosome segregation ATPase